MTSANWPLVRTSATSTPLLSASAWASNSRVPWPIQSLTCCRLTAGRPMLRSVSLTAAWISVAVSIRVPSRSNIINSKRPRIGWRCAFMVRRLPIGC